MLGAVGIEPTPDEGLEDAASDCTRPTCPSMSLTLTPLGWSPFVKMSDIEPVVSLPDRWSALSTILTATPGRKVLRLGTAIMLLML